MPLLKKSEYEKSVRRPYPPLFSSLIQGGYKNAKNFVNIVSPAFKIVHQIQVDKVWYYTKKEMKRGGELAYNNWIHPQKLHAVKKEFARREKNLLKTTSGNDFKAYCEAYEFYMPAVANVWLADVILAKNIRTFLEKKLSSPKLEELLNALNIPLQDNYYKKEEYDLVKTKNIAAHVKKYEWIHSRYGEIYPYTVGQARTSLKKINREKFLAEWKKSKQAVRAAIKLAKGLLPLKHRPIVDLMQYLIFYRTHRTDVMNRSHYEALPLLQNYAAKLGLTYTELLHCTKEELFTKVPSKTILRQRMHDYVMDMTDGKIRCLVGKQAKKLKNHLAENTAGISELKGSVACQGLVTGKVKIIRSRNDFSKMKKGDILVTSMTNPHMVPIMKLAGAIITDEGGITCHAAIISRELKKPCIIGTKHATSVFQDGDLILVDANNGTIKKL